MATLYSFTRYYGKQYENIFETLILFKLSSSIVDNGDLADFMYRAISVEYSQF